MRPTAYWTSCVGEISKNPDSVRREAGIVTVALAGLLDAVLTDEPQDKLIARGVGDRHRAQPAGPLTVGSASIEPPHRL